MRALFLRHHRGAINILPYGEIKQLRNTSRDWMIMVMEFRLAFDTDLRKVKKILKQIGEEIAADPELGPELLQPLKSQGVNSTDDSALVVRAKYMARPGNGPFMIRRVAYEKILKAFAEHGIEFASRRVADLRAARRRRRGAQERRSSGGDCRAGAVRHAAQGRRLNANAAGAFSGRRLRCDADRLVPRGDVVDVVVRERFRDDGHHLARSPAAPELPQLFGEIERRLAGEVGRVGQCAHAELTMAHDARRGLLASGRSVGGKRGPARQTRDDEQQRPAIDSAGAGTAAPAHIAHSPAY